MIAALYQSHKQGGSNCFVHNVVMFGWEAIEDMLAREVARIIIKKKSYHVFLASRRPMFIEIHGQGLMLRLLRLCRYVY